MKDYEAKGGRITNNTAANLVSPSNNMVQIFIKRLLDHEHKSYLVSFVILLQPASNPRSFHSNIITLLVLTFTLTGYLLLYQVSLPTCCRPNHPTFSQRQHHLLRLPPSFASSQVTYLFVYGYCLRRIR